MDKFILGERSFAVAESSFAGYINRANYDRPDLSFLGFTLGATVDDPKLAYGDEPVSIWAAGIRPPKELRTWLQLDGLELEFAGDNSWTFTCFDGQDHHCLASNRWRFKLISGATFHITWAGNIDYEDERGLIPILVSLTVPFDGIEVSDTKSAADANALLLQYFDVTDFLPPVSDDGRFIFRPNIDRK